MKTISLPLFRHLLNKILTASCSGICTDQMVTGVFAAIIFATRVIAATNNESNYYFYQFIIQEYDMKNKRKKLNYKKIIYN